LRDRKRKNRLGFWHFMFRHVLILSPMLVGAPLVSILFDRKHVEPAVALAVYGAEVQIFAIFATLTPIFFVFMGYYSRGKWFLRELTGMTVITVATSIIGIGWCIYSMVVGDFEATSVLMPLIFVGEFFVTISLGLLAYGGFKRAQRWTAFEK
jgi:hypothetical protein